MGTPRNSLQHLRNDKLYLILISLVCIFLLGLSIISLYQQQALVRSFSDKQLSLQGERLAIEIERRSLQLAQACLTDPALQNMAQSLAGSADQHKLSATQLDKIRKDHPIAENFYLMQDGQLLLQIPKKFSSQAKAFELAGSSAEKKFVSLLHAGALASQTGNLKQAITLFESAKALDVSEAWQAEAELRLASCYKKAKQPTDAVRTFGYLRDHYGDYMDASYQPYAVLAVLELDSLIQDRAKSADQLILAYQQLTEGRWQSNEATVERLKKELRQRLGNKTPAQEASFINPVSAANAVETKLRSIAANPNERFQRVVPTNPPMQLFGLVLPPHNGHSRILAFTVDEAWLKNQFLEECKNSLSDEIPVAAYQIRSKPTKPTSDLVMPFWAVFPFLELYLPPEGILATKTNLKIQLWISIGSAALMGCLLYLVVTLLLGISRELRAIQTKNDFLTKVSHELKTPLTVIMLYNETMLSDENMDPQKRRDCHKIIAREGERLKRLIDNLLHLSKHGKTKPSYNMRPGNLSEVVEKTVRACADWLETTGLDITIDLAQYLPQVQFDPEKVTQALMNLLDNARKYSGQTEKIDIRTYCDGSCVVLEVRDYGPGIPEEERKSIFEKYYRATETKGESGTGLGLYIVREILQAHGGTVEATAAAPRGTIFRLSFPC